MYQFTFEFFRDEPFEDDEQLLAAPVTYLMLRAKRNFEGKLNNVFEEFSDLSYSLDSDEMLYHRFQPQRHDKTTPEIYFSRKYTPFEVNEALRTFKIIVKLEPFGRMSTYFTRLHIGSICEFKGPFEAYKYVHEKIENFIVFTQGSCQLR